MQPEKTDKRKLSILAISDTHSSQKILNDILQLRGDIFIHAGDFTSHGREQNFNNFFKFLEKLDFTHKIVICGNHEISMDRGFMTDHHRNRYLNKYPCKLKRDFIKEQLKKRCTYLEHEAIEIEGIKIFGSPFTPLYCNSAFQYKPELDQVLWSKIPKEVDILITHSPPLGILDKNTKGKSAGSKSLAIMSLNRKPKYHIFGHIHEAAGMQKKEGVTFINVAKNPTRLTFQVRKSPE